MPSFRTVGLVALFELYESLRSRRAIALLALYSIAALGASAAFIRTLDALRAQLGPSAAMAESLVESEPFVREIGQLLGSIDLARSMVAIPPLALFYGWLALNAVPLLVVFTSSDAIASDRDSGAARFVLFRTDRLSWALGKLAGQLSLMVVGVALGAVVSLVLGRWLLRDFSLASNAWWMARFGGRACCYGFAYLGLALCASQWARSPGRARWFGMALLTGCWLLGDMLQAQVVVDKIPMLASAVFKLLPAAHYEALWQPAFALRLRAMMALLAIGMGFFALGFVRFARQDA